MLKIAFILLSVSISILWAGEGENSKQMIRNLCPTADDTVFNSIPKKSFKNRVVLGAKTNPKLKLLEKGANQKCKFVSNVRNFKDIIYHLHSNKLDVDELPNYTSFFKNIKMVMSENFIINYFPIIITDVKYSYLRMKADGKEVSSKKRVKIDINKVDIIEDDIFILTTNCDTIYNRLVTLEFDESFLFSNRGDTVQGIRLEYAGRTLNLQPNKPTQFDLGDKQGRVDFKTEIMFLSGRSENGELSFYLKKRNNVDWDNSILLNGKWNFLVQKGLVID